MNEDKFFQYRKEFQHEIAFYDREELPLVLQMIKNIRALTDRQVEHLIDDVRLMIDYRNTDRSTQEAWASIERGFRKS